MDAKEGPSAKRRPLHHIASTPTTLDPLQTDSTSQTDATALLQMQRLVGNRAVQRLLGTNVIQTDGRRRRRAAAKAGASAGTPASSPSPAPEPEASTPTPVLEPEEEQVADEAEEAPEEAAPVETVESKRETVLATIDASMEQYKTHRVVVSKALTREMPRGFSVHPSYVDRVLEAISRKYPWPPDLAKYAIWRGEVAAMTTLDKLNESALRVSGIDAGIAALDTETVAYVGRLNATKLKAYTDMVTNGETAPNIAASLQTDWNKRITLGALDGYYKSKHDKDESFALGMSYSIENTPFVVHLHAKGSGTSLVGLSIKNAGAQGGAAVVSGPLLGTSYKDLQSGLVAALNAHAESPRVISVGVRNGTLPARR